VVAVEERVVRRAESQMFEMVGWKTYQKVDNGWVMSAGRAVEDSAEASFVIRLYIRSRLGRQSCMCYVLKASGEKIKEGIKYGMLGTVSQRI
jgi:hypothetical protein